MILAPYRDIWTPRKPPFLDSLWVAFGSHLMKGPTGHLAKTTTTGHLAKCGTVCPECDTTPTTITFTSSGIGFTANPSYYHVPTSHVYSIADAGNENGTYTMTSITPLSSANDGCAWAKHLGTSSIVDTTAGVTCADWALIYRPFSDNTDWVFQISAFQPSTYSGSDSRTIFTNANKFIYFGVFFPPTDPGDCMTGFTMTSGSTVGTDLHPGYGGSTVVTPNA